MAQLNPNFEIDFNDINSYEQIQLINDTQLAKENLLMHKAYKEPAEDEIIRNQFSSFTFVDFCPKLFNSASKSSPDDKNAPHTSSSSPSAPLRHHQYMLETFSDLFDRINLWLRVNRDWRVISMETLIFDCASQFNHLKSSFHSANLPRNMRGLRLYLSPTKSRFSGPQKIGCINVIPRKISGRKLQDDGSDIIEYETLDQILARLNELLLTRPIEGEYKSLWRAQNLFWASDATHRDDKFVFGDEFDGIIAIGNAHDGDRLELDPSVTPELGIYLIDQLSFSSSPLAHVSVHLRPNQNGLVSLSSDLLI